MILSDVFERFSRDSPLSVMAQGIMENALNPQILDQLFEDTAEKQYTNKLLFSTIVDLMSVVVCRIRPSINAAYKKHASLLGVTRKAVYDKLEDGTFVARIPPCQGVIAFGQTLRECEEGIRSTLEDWVLLGIKLGHPLPVIGGLDLNREPLRETVDTL